MRRSPRAPTLSPFACLVRRDVSFSASLDCSGLSRFSGQSPFARPVAPVTRPNPSVLARSKAAPIVQTCLPEEPGPGRLPRPTYLRAELLRPACSDHHLVAILRAPEQMVPLSWRRPQPWHACASGHPVSVHVPSWKPTQIGLCSASHTLRCNGKERVRAHHRCSSTDAWLSSLHRCRRSAQHESQNFFDRPACLSHGLARNTV